MSKHVDVTFTRRVLKYGSLFTTFKEDRHNFFTYRAAKMWNDLPSDSTDFSSLSSFKRLTSTFLATLAKVNFF